MPSRTRWLLPALAASLLAPPLAAQPPVEEPQLKLNAIELSVGGRIHTQFNSTTIDTQQPSEVFFRRVRVELGIRVSDRISGAIQPDFANDEIELKDAYVKLEVAPALEVLVGNAHRPFGLLEQTTSKRMLPIERGVRIRGLTAADEYSLTSGLGYSNRDIGFQLLGAPEDAPLGLAYAAGVFRGPLHGDVGPQDSYQFAARVTARPAESLRLGAGWSHRDFASGTGETPELRGGDAFEVDLEYGAFAPGLHVLAELSHGDLDPFIDATFWGAQVWLGYRTGELGPTVSAIEPIFRVSWADTESDGTGTVVPGGVLLTPGVNLHFRPLNRLMLNYDIWLGGDGSRDAGSFKAMAQLAF